ncbi:MAG: amino acid ABC transporter permease [Lentisphaeria bacterium]
MNDILNVIQEYGIPFLNATVKTLQLTSVSLLLAMVIGLAIALCKLSRFTLLNYTAKTYIGIIRGLPLIVQLMFLYFGIVKLVALSSFWAGSLALAIHAGAYVAEIFRGSIESIDAGQTEAARSLGMSKLQTMFLIVLPQAFRRAIPPLGNQFIIGLKDSSLVAYLGVNELFGAALSAQAENFMPFETYMVAGIYYLILVLIFSFMVHKLEQHLNRGTREVVAA